MIWAGATIADVCATPIINTEERVGSKDGPSTMRHPREVLAWLVGPRGLIEGRWLPRCGKVSMFVQGYCVKTRAFRTVFRMGYPATTTPVATRWCHRCRARLTSTSSTPTRTDTCGWDNRPRDKRFVFRIFVVGILSDNSIVFIGEIECTHGENN